MYLFLILEYVYQYHFRYNIYAAESWFRSSKDLIKFVDDNRIKYNNIYIASAGEMFLVQYGLYNKIDPKEISKLWKEAWPKKYNNVFFLENCNYFSDKEYNPKSFLPNKSLYIVPDSCYKKYKPYYSIKDLGEPLRTIWKVYEN